MRIRRSRMSNSHVQSAKAIAEDIAHLYNPALYQSSDAHQQNYINAAMISVRSSAEGWTLS